MRTIELLAPAKNLACGIAAIDHGADAVYIGASRFGARQSAGNNVEDIHELCEYAHRFGVTVHVTINTIIYDSELEETIALVRELVEAGVDAFLLQDMGLMSEVKKIVPETVALHASTQCDTRTWEKASWLSQQGFDRVVLARELSSEEISGIHKHLPDLELEAFVHGALCVSYSGICYASQYCFGRSANRGACAQFCRLAFDLKDSDGKTIEHQKHLLSLKDMSQIDNLETLMRSGACAFKIEGRLKDINYVKNVVSAYSQRINEIIGKYPKEFCRASLGRVQYTFTPDLKKTFNRGYTNYFLNGRQPDIFSPNTPKALGEYVGRVKEIRRDSFNVAGTATFANGDGLCFLASGQVGENSSGQVESGRNSINPSTVLQGFRVNRAIGNRLYPFKMPKGLKPGMALYRNQDQSFDKELSGTTAVRKIPIRMRFGLTNDGFKVDSCITSLDERRTTITFAHQLAQKPQHDNIVRQLSKLGNTVYECSEVEIEDGADSYFIPSSILAELRRKVVEELDTQVQQMKRVVTHRQTNDKGQGLRKRQQFSLVNPSQYNELPYLYNISNDAARKFYEHQGLSKSESAFECQQPNGVRQGGEADLLLMQCRHCIRYSLGYCVKRGGKSPKWHEPLYLELPDKRRFRLEFDCKNCQMNVLPE
jgi:peptidase, U32 family